MKIFTTLCLLLAATTSTNAQSRIVCTPHATSSAPVSSIWPDPYISKSGELCFDVKAWPEYSGKNCVSNHGKISWTGLVIVPVDGESQGRDSTSFRVVNPSVNSEYLEYVIEWRRSGPWSPMQHVKINRLSGDAVGFFVTMHGGDSFLCRYGKKML